MRYATALNHVSRGVCENSNEIVIDVIASMLLLTGDRKEMGSSIFTLSSKEGHTFVSSADSQGVQSRIQ
jgi:hypothetical protein